MLEVANWPLKSRGFEITYNHLPFNIFISVFNFKIGKKLLSKFLKEDKKNRSALKVPNS